MVSSNKIKLSWQEGKGWKKSIGKHQGKNGKCQYKMWYLGMDQSIAEDLAEFITVEWKQVRISGGATWTPEALQRISGYKKDLTAASNNKEQRSTQSPGRRILTYCQAIDYYCNEFIPQQSFSEQWKRDLTQRTQSLKDAMEDVTLKSIGHEELVGLVNYYKKRPPNKNRRNRPISIKYAGDLISTAKRLFEWLDDTERWNSPKRFDRIFRVSQKSFRLTNSDHLKAVEGKRVFSVEELARLYRNANFQVREYMIMALNCGFTQSEIDSLLRGEVHLDESPPYIKRVRRKPNDLTVVGRWELWHETAVLLERRKARKYQFEYRIDDDGIIWFKHIEAEEWRKYGSYGRENYNYLQETKRKADSRVLTDKDCVFVESLVYFNQAGQKSDNAASAWWRLLNKTPSVRRYSFKSLRKTGADMILKITGSPEIVQTYLSHKPTTVAGRHYTNRDYDRLAEELRKMRIELEPMFLAGKE